jgi:hypothetical protein
VDAVPYFHGHVARLLGDLIPQSILQWLDDMEKDNMLVAVFPNLELSGAVIKPSLLKKDLQLELEKYDEDGKKIKK